MPSPSLLPCKVFGGFVAAKIWRHSGRTGVSYSDHYEEKGLFERLMGRLRRIAPRAQGYGPVMLPALR